LLPEFYEIRISAVNQTDNFMYAIVDIETTGSYAAANGITELAIHIFDGKNVTRKFETLINPGQPIPSYIQSFTGITNEMVAHAPSFDEVAGKVFSLLNNSIFVAHNVNFDYSFLKSHLLRAGYHLTTKKLCTVRLSRKIFPGFPSYSLGNLCHSLNITLNNRHRAGGDATATVEVFKKLLANDREDFIAKSLHRNSKEQILPPNLPKKYIDQLPESPGVYYFHNAKGKIIYIGKAVNLRQRVTTHFSNNSGSRQKQNFLRHIHSISFRSCATELMAQVLESAEIKRHWPALNLSQKKQDVVWGLYIYEDQNGYLRMAIDKARKNLPSLYTFPHLTAGHALLRKLIQSYSLCPKLCFLHQGTDACSDSENTTCRGACRKLEKPGSYNKRVKKAIEEISTQPSFAILDKGLKDEEQSCILVLNGKFFGMGYLPVDIPVHDTETVKEYLTPYKENQFICNLLLNYKSKFPSKVIELNKPSGNRS
jgi:DNA polymerase-3 subunit epsilon